MKNMKDAQNLTIVLLTISAVIVAAALLSAYRSTENTAYAEMSVKQGDYILGAGSITEATDLIYVVDIAARQLNTYAANTNTNVIEIIDTVDLDKAFRQ